MNSFESDIRTIRSDLSKDALAYIHFRSMQNFILYFDQIRDQHNKDLVDKYIKEYFCAIKNADGIINKNLSNFLYENSISKLGIYFQRQFGFRVKIRPTTFIPAILIDLFLLGCGFLRLIYYFPFFSCLVTIFYLNDRLKYQKLNKLWGYRY